EPGSGSRQAAAKKLRCRPKAKQVSSKPQADANRLHAARLSGAVNPVSAPAASACWQALCYASACVLPIALTWFSKALSKGCWYLSPAFLRPCLGLFEERQAVHAEGLGQGRAC